MIAWRSAVVDLIVDHPVAAAVHDHAGGARLVPAVEIVDAAVRHRVPSGEEVLLAPPAQDNPP